MPYANTKCADQPAHSRSLISAFVLRCLGSITSSFYIRNFKPIYSFCGCAGRFKSSLVANPEDRFSRDKAHFEKVPLVYIQTYCSSTATHTHTHTHTHKTTKQQQQQQQQQQQNNNINAVFFRYELICKHAEHDYIHVHLSFDK